MFPGALNHRPQLGAQQRLWSTHHPALRACCQRSSVIRDCTRARLRFDEALIIRRASLSAGHSDIAYALNNIAKHSRAKQVLVNLSANSSGTALSVNDDGVGFDPTKLTGIVSSVGGLGLQQMRERIEARGGRFDYVSSLGAGTKVSASLP